MVLRKLQIPKQIFPLTFKTTCSTINFPTVIGIGVSWHCVRLCVCVCACTLCVVFALRLNATLDHPQHKSKDYH